MDYELSESYIPDLRSVDRKKRFDQSLDKNEEAEASATFAREFKIEDNPSGQAGIKEEENESFKDSEESG